MIRLIFVAAIVIGFLLFSLPYLAWLDRLGNEDPHKKNWKSLHIVQAVFRLILKLAGVRVTVRGAENIPADRAVLFVGNHRSYFDILVGYTTVPGLMGFVAKKEMEKIPSLSKWMKNVNCLFLDRKNVKEGLKTILVGIEQVKKGISVWIFPEGTRNRGEVLEMLPFKEGSLKIAEKSGCYVIPVAITGTAEIFEKQFPRIKKSHVIVEYGKPIDLKALEPQQRKFAGAYVRGVILEMLKAQLEEREHEKK
ncbi:MAG: lysophospholipid acyltransferase family protein [bacterium]|nr:lysophospholipid acyltransferase family protein [bacterium]